MNLFFLIIILLSSFSYNYSNIEEANALFKQGNQELIHYYNAHHNLDYSLCGTQDIKDAFDYVKEGLILLIRSGEIYFQEYQLNNQTDYVTKLQEINVIIYRYINLLKKNNKQKILKQWEPIKKELNL